MKNLPLLLASPLAAAVLLVAALPAYAACSFQARGLSLSFGTLDPSSGSNKTVAVSASTLNANKAGGGSCSQAMTISADNGLNFSGSRRLAQGTGTDFIAYSLAGLPLNVPDPSQGGSNNNYVPFSFTGTILWSDYANAPAGSYSDTVLISVNP